MPVPEALVKPALSVDRPPLPPRIASVARPRAGTRRLATEQVPHG
jgi:hypothetical protein